MTFLLITVVTGLWAAAGLARLSESPAARIDIDRALATDGTPVTKATASGIAA